MQQCCHGVIGRTSFCATQCISKTGVLLALHDRIAALTPNVQLDSSPTHTQCVYPTPNNRHAGFSLKNLSQTEAIRGRVLPVIYYSATAEEDCILCPQSRTALMDMSSIVSLDIRKKWLIFRLQNVLSAIRIPTPSRSRNKRNMYAVQV
jgi:hypothetical protein